MPGQEGTVGSTSTEGMTRPPPRVCNIIRYSIVASIPPCHGGDRVSIPRVGDKLDTFSIKQNVPSCQT